MGVPTLEYTTIDKSLWGPGPWQSEPDKRQWLDEATGLACMIRRTEDGHLCGYVGVPEGHPAFEKGYEYVDARAHGGLTYAASCNHEDNPESGICHVTTGEEPRTWWLGFDCAHCYDQSPGYRKDYAPQNGEYRDFAYVTAEVEALAKQLKAMN